MARAVRLDLQEAAKFRPTELTHLPSCQFVNCPLLLLQSLVDESHLNSAPLFSRLNANVADGRCSMGIFPDFVFHPQLQPDPGFTQRMKTFDAKSLKSYREMSQYERKLINNVVLRSENAVCYIQVLHSKMFLISPGGLKPSIAWLKKNSIKFAFLEMHLSRANKSQSNNYYTVHLLVNL